MTDDVDPVEVEEATFDLNDLFDHARAAEFKRRRRAALAAALGAGPTPEPAGDELDVLADAVAERVLRRLGDPAGNEPDAIVATAVAQAQPRRTTDFDGGARSTPQLQRSPERDHNELVARLALQSRAGATVFGF